MIEDQNWTIENIKEIEESLGTEGFIEELARRLTFSLGLPPEYVGHVEDRIRECKAYAESPSSQAALSAAQAKRDRKAEKYKIQFKNGSEIVSLPSHPEDSARSYRQRLGRHQQCVDESLDVLNNC
jgi:hypothetical protein